MKIDEWIHSEQIGSIIGETSPIQALFIVENRGIRPKLGEYVVIDYGPDTPLRERYVLGMIESIYSGNPLAPGDLDNPYAIPKLRVYDETRRRTYLRGVIRLLSYISTILPRSGIPIVEAPKTPPPPLSLVYRASSNLLRKVFSERGHEWIRIGVLASHPDVPYSVNVNYIVQRHLAILAVTGAGKSNAVALLVSRIVDKLNGTVLVFDMHSEYASSNLGVRTNVIQPLLNPLHLDISEFLQLVRIPSNAWRQEYILRSALESVKKAIINKDALPKDFFDELKQDIELLITNPRKSRIKVSGRVSEWQKAASSVLNKIDDLLFRYGSIFSFTVSKDLKSIIRPGYLNIMDLGGVDEDTADVVVHHYLRRLYYERKRYIREKNGYPDPILVVLEEAHVLVPRNEDRLTKYWVSRLAREGRKFGIGLCLVSQRPKVIDENALSQTNNKIILKLVEPNDLRYVQYASEYLSDELLKILPGLNIGEAVVLGLMTPLPAIVKVDICPGKSGGRDIDAVTEWSRRKSLAEEAKELIKEEIDIAGL